MKILGELYKLEFKPKTPANKKQKSQIVEVSTMEEEAIEEEEKEANCIILEQMQPAYDEEEGKTKGNSFYLQTSETGKGITLLYPVITELVRMCLQPEHQPRAKNPRVSSSPINVPDTL